MATEQRRVIWRHPKGIYETVEVSGTGVFGVPYSYRETVYTANRDARGVARKAWRTAAEIRSTNEVKTLKQEKGAKTS